MIFTELTSRRKRSNKRCSPIYLEWFQRSNMGTFLDGVAQCRRKKGTFGDILLREWTQKPWDCTRLGNNRPWLADRSLYTHPSLKILILHHTDISLRISYLLPLNRILGTIRNIDTFGDSGTFGDMEQKKCFPLIMRSFVIL